MFFTCDCWLGCSETARSRASWLSQSEHIGPERPPLLLPSLNLSSFNFKTSCEANLRVCVAGQGNVWDQDQ